MNSTRELLSVSDRLRINRAISDAERLTSAEILPAVAPLSGRYDRAEDLVGLWTGIILCGLVWHFFQGVTTGGGDWTDDPQIAVGFPVLLLVLLGGFVLGAVLASRIDWLRRLFTPDRQMEEESLLRAKEVFFDSRLHRTEAATGVLIYVSLYERKVVLLTDDAIRAQLSDRSLEEVRDTLLTSLRKNGLVEGLDAAIHLLGKFLEVSLPAREGHANEVRNEVIVLDGSESADALA